MFDFLFMIAIVAGFVFVLKRVMGESTSTNWLLSLVPKGWEQLFGGEKMSGSQFMPAREERKFLNASHEGLLLDGIGQKRLDLKSSYENVAIISPVGGGKSTRYIIPNLCGLDDCSIVATDPSGELYEKTSGYMAAKGFDVKVLNLANPSHGLCYNPLARANSYTEIDKLSGVIMSAANPVVKPGDEIWINEPQTLLTVLITCLKSSGEPEWMNLHNLLFLLQQFGADGKPLKEFVRRNSPNDGNRTLNQFIAFCNGHEKMVSSFLTMARNALKIINNPEIASMMARDEFDFDAIRKRKTVIYLIVPETDAKHYSFILNLFYTQLFEAIKKPQYITEGLPIHILYDEFGHSAIPEFATIATTIRKFRVSLSLILQNYGQLEKQYGKEEAQTIFSGGVRTKLVYSGLDVNTSKMVEEMLGKVVVEQKSGNTNHRREDNLMNADRIRRIGEDQALCVSANKEPIMLNTTPSFRDPTLRKITSMPPAPLPNPLPVGNLKYTSL